MDAKLSQFIGCRTANTACSPGNKCRRRIISHFVSSLNLKPNIYIPRLGQKTGRRTRPILLLTPCACPASFPAVPGLEVELIDIVLRESERIPQHDHVLQRERTLGRDVLERCDRVARAQPSCRHLGLRLPPMDLWVIYPSGRLTSTKARA